MPRDVDGRRYPPLFGDRREAGRLLADELEDERSAGTVVVGLARGGVVVAAEVARGLGAPLDVVAVRKVGHPDEPEYAIGAVTPGDGLYLRADAEAGLTEAEIEGAVAAARARAVALDGRLRAGRAPVELAGATAVLVDDGLATGATMVAAVRWARASGSARVVAAVPVAAADSLELVRTEADRVVCPYAVSPFLAVSIWYGRFGQVDDATVTALLGERGASRAVSP